MKNKITQNWREMVGWIVILLLFVAIEANMPFRYAEGGRNPFANFEAFAVLAVVILIWLRINRKNP